MEHILIFYINVGDGSMDSIQQTMAKVKNAMSKNQPKGWIYYFFPVRTETKVECVNPQLINEKEYDEIKKEIDKLNQRVADVLNGIKNE